MGGAAAAMKAMKAAAEEKKASDVEAAPSEAPKAPRAMKTLSKEQALKHMKKEASKLLRIEKEARLKTIKKQRADAKADLAAKDKAWAQEEKDLQMEIGLLKFL